MLKRLKVIISIMIFSLGTFGFADTISFKQGWNFIGLNNTINFSTNSTFSDETKVKMVWKYLNDEQASSQGWQIYSANSDIQQKIKDIGLKTTDSLLSSEGCWVYAIKDFNYSVKSKNHNLKNSDIILNDGWNCFRSRDCNGAVSRIGILLYPGSEGFL